jgi:lipoprotein
MRHQQTFVIVALALSIVGLSCNRKNAEEEAKRRADSIAAVQARADSIMRIADSLQQLEIERERAQQTEAIREQQYNASLKFHVIKGSFIYQDNADRFLELQRRSFPEAKQFMAPNGFKLISIADFGSMSEAVAYINRTGSSEDGLWVFEEGGRYDTSSWLNSERPERSSSGSTHKSSSSSDDDDIVTF